MSLKKAIRRIFNPPYAPHGAGSQILGNPGVGTPIFGGVSPIYTDGSAETDFINREIPPGLWNNDGESLHMSIVIKTPKSSENCHLRGHVNGEVGYDSGSFCVAEGSTFFIEFVAMRVDHDKLSITARLLGDVPDDALKSHHLTKTVDFSGPVWFRLSGQTEVDAAMCYQHGWSILYAAPVFLEKV